MANIKTKEQLQQLFQERKAINNRKKEQEKKRYKRASEAIKKILLSKHKAEHKQTPPKPLKTLNFNIYSSPVVEREPREEDLYSKDELLNIETLFPEEEGRINWSVWNQLVENFHKNVLA